MPGLWDRLVSGKDKAAFEADKLRQVAALQSHIRGLQRQIEQSFATLGAATFRLYREGHVHHPELQQACAALTALQGQIDECEREIEALRQKQFEETASGGHVCPNGHGALPPQNRFCHICGAEAILASPPRGQTPFAGSVVTCARCGSAAPAGVAFCAGCGAPLAKPQAQPSFGWGQPAAAYSPPAPPTAQPIRPDTTAPLVGAQPTRICPNCHAQVGAENQWCLFCGTALDSAGPEPAANATTLLPETQAAHQPASDRATILLPETLVDQEAGETQPAPEGEPAELSAGAEPESAAPEPPAEAEGKAAQPSAGAEPENVAPEPLAVADGEAPPAYAGATMLLPETAAEQMAPDPRATTLLPETELEALAPAVACPRCGAAATPGARWCTNCGAELKAQPGEAAATAVISAAAPKAACRLCGEDLIPGNAFCVQCGNAV
jgi:predicted amidophosphoribosyltransferase